MKPIAPPEVYRAIEQRFPEGLEKTRQLLRQPSVSATGEGVAECAEMVRSCLAELGCKTETFAKGGHPLVVGYLDVGADTTLVSGPTALVDPSGVRVVRVETAAEMLAACTAALPVDVAVCAAAVADWRPAAANDRKLKKERKSPSSIELTANPDILRALAGAGNRRPSLLIGFAAETEDDAAALVALASAKRKAKGCDWIVANDVSASRTFGADETVVHVIDGGGAGSCPPLTKEAVGERLARRISDPLAARPCRTRAFPSPFPCGGCRAAPGCRSPTTPRLTRRVSTCWPRSTRTWS